MCLSWAGHEGVLVTVHDSDLGGSSGYERSIAQAGALVAAHLKAFSDDLRLSHERDDEGPSLYRAVAAVFPEIERMHLSSSMWDQAIDAATTGLSHDGNREQPDVGAH